MYDEYGFTKNERSKFYGPDARTHQPVYLDAEVLDYVSARAKAKGVALNVLINDLLKKHIALIEEGQ